MKFLKPGPGKAVEFEEFPSGMGQQLKFPLSGFPNMRWQESSAEYQVHVGTMQSRSLFTEVSEGTLTREAQMRRKLRVEHTEYIRAGVCATAAAAATSADH